MADAWEEQPVTPVSVMVTEAVRESASSAAVGDSGGC